METLKCIETRRSIRKFTDQKPDKEILEKVVQAASFAPSWKNTQVTRYNVVSDQGLKDQIAKEGVLGFQYNSNTIQGAPELVVVSVVHGRSGFERDGSYTTSKEDRWEMFDAGIATQTFCLAAHEYGLGTVIMGIFDESKIAELVKLPEGEKVAAILAIGYPAEEPAVPKRKDVTDLLRIL